MLKFSYKLQLKNNDEDFLNIEKQLNLTWLTVDATLETLGGRDSWEIGDRIAAATSVELTFRQRTFDITANAVAFSTR